MVKKFDNRAQLTASKAAPIKVIQAKDVTTALRHSAILQLLHEQLKDESSKDDTVIMSTAPARKALKISELGEHGTFLDFFGMVSASC